MNRSSIVQTNLPRKELMHVYFEIVLAKDQKCVPKTCTRVVDRDPGQVIVTKCARESAALFSYVSDQTITGQHRSVLAYLLDPVNSDCTYPGLASTGVR